jgi:hypothetical protein
MHTQNINKNKQFNWYENNFIFMKSKHLSCLWQRSRDIIALPTCMLQFSSEMQQTWHIYRTRGQNSETGLKFCILVLTTGYPFKGPLKRHFLGICSSQRALQSKYFLEATSVKLVHVLHNNFYFRSFSISCSSGRGSSAESFLWLFYSLREYLLWLSYCMYQRVIFSGARQFIGQILLENFII